MDETKLLKDATIEELEDALDKATDKKRFEDMPIPMSSIDVDKIKQACIEHVINVASEQYDNGHGETCVFEAAMEAIYGKGIWDWYRERA